MSLTSIPSCILDAILEQCSCRDLALLACASKALDDVVGTSQVWEHACLSKWPQCNVDWYDGNWKALYGKRMQQPSSLPGLVDSAVSLVQQGHAAFQPYLNRLLALGLLYHAWPQATKHVEHKQLAESVRFWMEEQPQVALAAVKVVYDQLLTFNPAAHMEAACMRSAMHFMMEGTLACGHPSFLGRLERELAQLDMLLKKCQVAAEGPAMKRRAAQTLPAHLPVSHWWWG